MFQATCLNPSCRHSFSADAAASAICPKCEGTAVAVVTDAVATVLPSVDRSGALGSTWTTDAPTGEDTAEVAPPVAIVGRFLVRSKLGEGAFGEVYRAHDPQLDREVALKVAKPGTLDSPERIGRFLREARAAANLRHPNIVPVFDSGKDGGRHFIATGFIDGRTLEAEIDDADQKPLDLKRAASVIRKLAEALGYAHKQGVVHRDVKPANVLVDRAGEPSLTDFGLAVRAGDEAVKTQDGRVLGTPAYMSPEQAAGRSAEATAASDQYALGVMLFEMATGRRPFEGRLEVVLAQQVQVPPRRPRSENRAIPKDLETVILKCLEKEPGKRYASCEALADDLRRFLDGEPVVARRIGPLERTARWAKRNPAVAGSLAFAMLALTVGLGAALWQASEARFQEKEASTNAKALQDETVKLNSQLKESQRLLDLSRLREADIEVEKGSILSASSNLAEIAPNNRCIGWGLLLDQLSGADLILSGHTHYIYDATFSPDGRRIVTASEDGTARVWDAVSGQNVLELKGHTASVYSASYSPDGTRIVTGSFDTTARVWDALSGQPILELKGHSDEVRSASYGPDGRRIVTGSLDRTARVWDAATGQPLTELKGHTHGVHSAAFSPDGRRIVTASEDRTARVWDTGSGASVLELRGHSGEVRSARYRPDGMRIVTGGGGADKPGEVRVWDATSGKSTLELHGHTKRVTSVGYSPDGARIVSATALSNGKPNEVWLWDAFTGKTVLDLKGHMRGVGSATFSPDGRRIVTGSDDMTARVWDADFGRSRTELKGHADGVSCIACSPDGRRIITGSRDRTARIWDAATSQPILELKGHSGEVTSVAYRSDGRRIVTGSNDMTARVWDTTTGLSLLELKGHRGPVSSVAYSSDGRRIVTGSGDTTARVWDATTGLSLLELSDSDQVIDGDTGAILIDETRKTYGVRGVTFNPDGTRIVTVPSQWEVRVWDAFSGEILLKLDTSLCGGNRCAGYSLDGQRIVIGSETGTVTVWDASTSEQLLELMGHTDPVTSAAFGTDGRRIITGSLDKTVRVWDATTGQALLVLKSSSGEVTGVAVSERERYLVSGSFGKTANVWKISDTSPDAEATLWTKPKWRSYPTTKPEPQSPRPLTHTELGRRQWIARADPERHVKLAEQHKADPFAAAMQLSLEQRARGQLATEALDFDKAQEHLLAAMLLKPKPHQWPELAPAPRPVR